ncbi:putative rubber elongation factor [Rosa chinensis]|uniref:Putative rubber elongation factor n=1 Tax=Rosa chinensis TaxID=74649 RepID=A0A2P6R763_ROSCH|nr:stress-related protein [Rosa chinensis]PRQ42261.1 putative rubber elongation factor [Rosa chinensis]
MAQQDSSVKEPQMGENKEEQSLKYLGFVQNAAVASGVCVTKVYGYAKERSGPLKNGVECVEGKVKTVVGPVYVKYQEAPAQILTFVDRKVDESVTKAAKLDVRPVIRQASSKALSVAQKAPETACTAAKSVYTKYEPKAEECAASAWRKLNELPVFPKVAGVVVPAAAYCSEKYNETVQHTAEKGYRVASYMPLVPTERIAKVFGEKVPEPEPLIAATHGETDIAVQ